MSVKIRTICTFIALFAGMPVAPALAHDMNESIKVEDGRETGGHSTVNGSITVGSDATVNGSLETVNGTIRIAQNSHVGNVETVNGGVRIESGVTARDISSVNGSVRLAENVSVDGEISVVNGRIKLDRGSSVSDDVSNVNGELSIVGATIGGDLSTVNGDVSLTENALLVGNLVVEKESGWNSPGRKPKIVIGPGAQVQGELILERAVELYISETAQVGGVSGVMGLQDATRFKGERP